MSLRSTARSRVETVAEGNPWISRALKERRGLAVTERSPVARFLLPVHFFDTAACAARGQNGSVGFDELERTKPMEPGSAPCASPTGSMVGGTKTFTPLGPGLTSDAGDEGIRR